MGRHGFSEMVFDFPTEPVVFGCFPCCSSRIYRFTSAGTTTRSMNPSTSGLTFLALVSTLGLLSAGFSTSILWNSGDSLPTIPSNRMGSVPGRSFQDEQAGFVICDERSGSVSFSTGRV